MSRSARSRDVLPASFVEPIPWPIGSSAPCVNPFSINVRCDGSVDCVVFSGCTNPLT